MRRILTALILFAPCAVLTAQSPAPTAFEVASVKLDPKDRVGSQTFADISLPVVRVLPGGRVESYGHTLRNLMAWAYDINTLYQKIEGQQEFLERKLVISAKVASPSLTSVAAKTMLRTLLEERFQLRWRWQPRDVEGYLLMPAREDGRTAPGLRSFNDDCDTRANNTLVSIDSPEYERKARCGWMGSISRYRGVGMSMARIAEQLALFMAAPVTDRTGWPGLFTFDVIASTERLPYLAILRSAAGFTPPQQADSPQLLEVFRRDLGLKLVKGRTTTNDLIVERVAPLIEN